MHQKTGKKINLFFYSLLIIILTSTNNYGLNSQNIFNIKYIDVNGFSKKKNQLIKNQIKKIHNENIFFINKDYFSELINRNDTKYLFIKKNFPNKLIVNFTPSKPICAIEIKNDKIILGDNGKILTNYINEKNLPIVLGSENISYIYYVVNLLKKSNLNYEIIKKIVFFKSGRFDINLNNGVIIKFPINFNQDIINQSNKLLNKKKFAEAKIIDLRIKNKIIKYE